MKPAIVRSGFLLSLALSACAQSARLERECQTLRTIAERARASGAYCCAPEELARSEAQLAFAQAELAQGDAARAREHLVLAGANARAALRLSSDPRCVERSSRSTSAGARCRPEPTNQAVRS